MKNKKKKNKERNKNRMRTHIVIEWESDINRNALSCNCLRDCEIFWTFSCFFLFSIRTTEQQNKKYRPTIKWIRKKLNKFYILRSESRRYIYMKIIDNRPFARIYATFWKHTHLCKMRTWPTWKMFSEK